MPAAKLLSACPASHERLVEQVLQQLGLVLGERSTTAQRQTFRFFEQVVAKSAKPRPARRDGSL